MNLCRFRGELRKKSWADVYDQYVEDFPFVLKLVDILISIPPTSVSCETTFSQLKVIKTCRRTKLKSETLNDILILKMESTKVEDFNPDDAIDIWTVSDQIKLMKLSDND